MPTDPPSPEALRSPLLAQIPALLEELGCDPAPVLRRAGIPRPLLASAEGVIPYPAAGRLLAESARATGLPHFGLLAGARFDPSSSLGELGQLMRHAPTVDVALRALVVHQHLNDSGAGPMLLPGSPGRVALAHALYRHDVPGLDVFYDGAMAYGMQIMRMICGRDWLPARVTLPRRRPADVAPYARAFGPQVGFDASVASLEFPSRLLEMPVAGADPGAFLALRERMRQRLQGQEAPLAAMVRRALYSLTFAGNATMPAVANLFSLHERVLRRRLAAEHTSVRQLLQEVRFEIGCQLLQGTNLATNEISAALGYADPPSFVRAFRKRSGGVTPGGWRARRDAARGD